MTIDGLHYSGPELDESQLNDLIGPVGSADLALLEELLSIYGQESEGILKEMDEAVLSCDRDALRKSLHNLAGSSSNVGLARLSRLAVQAENQVDSMAEGTNGELVTFFRSEYSQAMERIRTRYGLS